MKSKEGRSGSTINFDNLPISEFFNHQADNTFAEMPRRFGQTSNNEDIPLGQQNAPRQAAARECLCFPEPCRPRNIPVRNVGRPSSQSKFPQVVASGDSGMLGLDVRVVRV